MSWLDAFLNGVPGPPGPSGGSALVLGGSAPLAANGQQMGLGAGTIFAVRTLLPSADYPGTSSAIFSATLYSSSPANSPSGWAGTTVYAVGKIVSNGGTAWVCTTGGTSAASGGPLVEGPAVTDGSVVWRSAQTTLTVGLLTSSGLTTLATLSVGYQLAAAATGPGLATLDVSVDLSSTLFTLATRAAILLVIAGDPADTGGTKYTVGVCASAQIAFS